MRGERLGRIVLDAEFEVFVFAPLEGGETRTIAFLVEVVRLREVPVEGYALR